MNAPIYQQYIFFGSAVIVAILFITGYLDHSKSRLKAISLLGVLFFLIMPDWQWLLNFIVEIVRYGLMLLIPVYLIAHLVIYLKSLKKKTPTNSEGL